MKSFYIGYLVLLFLWSATACTEETLPERNIPDGESVRIAALRPEDGPVTRANVKESFSEGDIIHLSAVFTRTSGAPVSQYACLRFDGSEWTPIDHTDLKWKEEYRSADFTAYYFPSQNALTTGQPNIQPLAELHDANDPLKATVQDVAAGHTVYLQFEHLCTKLTFTKLTEKTGTNGSGSNVLPDHTELWLSRAGLNNGCQLLRKADGTLEFSFIRLDSDNRPTQDDASVYMPNRSVTGGEAVFLLEPGDYRSMKLTFAKNKPYLTFDLDQLNGLKQGIRYTLDITYLPGNMVSGQLIEEAYWDQVKQEGTVVLKDVNKFLQAISSGDIYIENATQILDVVTGMGGGKEVILLKNVDFTNRTFTPVPLGNTITFDGNYHSIAQVATSSGIFTTIEGNIRNLAISDGTVQATTTAGILGKKLSGSGTLRNIRLSGTNTIGLASAASPAMVGALIGEIDDKNTTLQDIEVEGKLVISAAGDQTLYVGGIAGMNAGTATRVVLSCESETSGLTVTTRADDATLHIGGLFGSSEGALTGCRSNIGVDASGAAVNLAYVGGLVGLAQKTITSCDASGAVKGAPVVGSGNGDLAMPGNSFTGGLIGLVQGITIDDCESLGDVYGAEASGTDAISAVGGAVGFARVTESCQNSIRFVNCASLGRLNVAGIAAPKSGAMIGGGEIDPSKTGFTIAVQNSFSLCRRTDGSTLAFIGDKTTGAMQPAIVEENCLLNQTPIEVTGSGTTLLERLNNGKSGIDGAADWIEGLFSAGRPYLKRK